MSEQPYCLMPFIHLHVGNHGKALACCVANIPYGNINEQSLEEIWNGDAIQNLRAKFKKGETDNRCKVCHKIEASGGTSIRLETMERYADLNLQVETKHPIYYDIRFSNVCNFRCRTCWHGASSKWFKEAQVLNNNLTAQALIKNVKDFDAFMLQLQPALADAKEFYFAGGEPLVTEEHYLLLQYMIDKGLTNVKLRYNTNFSQLNFKGYNVLEFWKHFEHVEILASIDAKEALGEYIRKDLVWNQILTNRNKIRGLSNVKFKIAPTVSVLNVNSIPSLYEYCKSIDLISDSDLYINILERPSYYNIQIIPSSKKEMLAKKYLAAITSETPLMVKKSFQEIIDYLFKEDQSALWPLFLQKTKELDEMRDESYKDFSSISELF